MGVSATRIQSIADVVQRLDDIVQYCISTKNRAGYFAALYKRMTIAVQEGIAHNLFKDGSRMEQLDIAFAQRYLTAWDCYRQHMPCSTSWQLAFDNCTNSNLIVLQHLILGINTHINLDLAIACATIAPGEKIHSLALDFYEIGNIIATLVDDIQQCLEEVWFPMRWLKRICNTQQQDVLNFSIDIARKTAWANAIVLAQLNAEQQMAQLQKMDNLVHTIGDRVVHPGIWQQALLRMIRATEYEDIARTIRLIDTTVVH